MDVLLIGKQRPALDAGKLPFDARAVAAHAVAVDLLVIKENMALLIA